jgi:hypothetical protein
MFGGMSYVVDMNFSGGAAVAARMAPAAPLPLHDIAHLQGHAVLIYLHFVHSGIIKEERNVLLLQDLGLNVADITDVFMLPSPQLLCIGFGSGIEVSPHYPLLQPLQTTWLCQSSRLAT